MVTELGLTCKYICVIYKIKNIFLLDAFLIFILINMEFFQQNIWEVDINILNASDLMLAEW